jgi:hypothetical protein
MRKTFIVPALENESIAEYQLRVSSMEWIFDNDRELSMPTIGTIILDGDKPLRSDFEEVV